METPLSHFSKLVNSHGTIITSVQKINNTKNIKERPMLDSHLLFVFNFTLHLIFTFKNQKIKSNYSK